MSGVGRIAVAALVSGVALAAPQAGAQVSGFLERLAVPEVELESPIWTERDEASAEQVDHAAWAQFLARHRREDADGVARIAYGAVSEADRALLDGYIAGLGAIDPRRLSGPEQLAYWINLYNATTVDLILENYPLESIRDIGSGVFETGPWDREVVTVLGRGLTLNEIEHGIIRAVWKEPRIHYAVNCAAVGCPNLGPEPYTGLRLDAQLAAAERAFVNNPRGVRLEDGRLVLSKIWLWFREDFAADPEGVVAQLRTVAEGPAAEALAARDEPDSYDYDWALNEAR